MHGRTLALAILLVTPLLAGCTEAPEPTEPTANGGEPNVVTSPDDYTAMGNESLANRSHIHDYWDGKQKLQLIDDTRRGGVGLWLGGPIAPHVFQPGSGDVVPQGTGNVTATFTWVEAPGDQYGKVELWVKTAADKEPWLVSELTSGEPVRFPSTNEQNDLPHQTLSAWEFHFVIHPRAENTPSRFQGEVTAFVEVERGLEIPVYPGHGDAWDGRTSIDLLEASHSVQYMGDAEGDWSCFGGCPVAHRPDDGVVVPWDAKVVEVTLTTDDLGLTGLGLKVHGADSRAFQVVEPAETQGNERVYRIQLQEGMGDGPYAKQSQWEFLPYIEQPEEDGFHSGSYTLTATALKV